jgi:hypothetical protein
MMPLTILKQHGMFRALRPSIRSLLHPVITTVLALIMTAPPSLHALAVMNRSYPTRYATIQYANDDDLGQFKWNITSVSFFGRSSKDNALVNSRIDQITETVMSLLDMHPIDIHFNILLMRGQRDVVAAYRSLGMMGHAPPAFYNHSSQSITVSVEDVTDGMLAHEIAHAVICAHFVTPPPVKMQEILAQFVDSHLNE